jgi:hypothetical protein
MYWTGTEFRPYTDVAEAVATVPAIRRHKGLFAIVGNLLYWYKDGVTDADLVSFTAASAGAVWGVITGTLNDQTDLKTALDAKLNVSDYNPQFKGKYPSLTALETAYPTASTGDSAQVINGSVWDNYMWDDSVPGWVIGASGSAATNTDELPEGTTNQYFTTARARASFTGASPRIKISGSGQIDIDTISTDDIFEGTKKFYTDTRARAALSVASGSALTYNAATGQFTLTLPAGLSLSGTSPINYNSLTGEISLDLSVLDERYSNAADSPTFSTGLHRDGNDVAALVGNALWNANKLQGMPVSSDPPLDGDILVYDGTLDAWILSDDWVPSMPEYANNAAAVAAGLAVGKMYKLPYDSVNDWQLTAIVH